MSPYPSREELSRSSRGIVADFRWIHTQDQWEARDWLGMYQTMESVTLLQPQSAMFWDLAGCNHGWECQYLYGDACAADSNSGTGP